MLQLFQQQQAGRVTRRYTAKGYQDYHYDVNGRLAKKIVHTRGFRPREWRYLWNTQNQLTACFTPKGDCWHYTYDAFGRRLSKTKTVDSDLAHIDPLFPQIKPKITTWRYLWSGDQLIEETPIYADGTLADAQQVQWLYQPGEITPTARYQQGKLHYVVTDHQGTPREIFSEGGQASWAGRLNTWGQMQFWRYRDGKAENDPNYTECPFRFAGQYEDEESGLYYNRFRYYDKETGQYLSPDPIGLLGGLNPYGYVHCPTGYIDPFGLAGGSGNKGDAGVGTQTNTPKDSLYIPRDANGKPVALDKQIVNGQDIPLPHPGAEGRAHTVLGGKVSGKTGEVYRQSATFPEATWPPAKGKPVPLSEVHWTSHGRPDHTNPHQHPFHYEGQYGWKRADRVPFDPNGGK
ncbi:TPA: RHS repeat domain-containing protein [Proteus mirabilis]